MELLTRTVSGNHSVFWLAGFAVALLTGWQTQASPYSQIDPHAQARLEARSRLCGASEEFIKTLKFLRGSKDFGFRENVSRQIADHVSKGCDGAAERFSKILLLLKTIGVSDGKTLEMGLEFASVSPEVQKNFLEIFTRAFLVEFFDYEFPKAMLLAFELSRDYKGDPERARKDFIELVRFCKDSKSLDLPMSFCSGYAVEVAKLSQFHEDGVANPFLKLFGELRERKDLQLDVKTSLQMSYEILKHGPKAPENFYSAFEFASKDFEFNKKDALDFALRLASRSHVGERPPLMQFVAPSSGGRTGGVAGAGNPASGVRGP